MTVPCASVALRGKLVRRFLGSFCCRNHFKPPQICSPISIMGCLLMSAQVPTVGIGSAMRPVPCKLREQGSMASLPDLSPSPGSSEWPPVALLAGSSYWHVPQTPRQRIANYCAISHMHLIWLSQALAWTSKWLLARFLDLEIKRQLGLLRNIQHK